MKSVIFLLLLFVSIGEVYLFRQNCVLDIVFLLDSSSSIMEDNWKQVPTFLQDTIDQFIIGPNNVQIGVDIFSDYARSLFKLNRFRTKSELKSAVRTISYLRGSTRTHIGIAHMVNSSFLPSNGHRQNVPKIGIVVTDGQSQSQTTTALYADSARRQGITLFAIGVGRGMHMPELKRIANDPDEDYVYSIEDLNAVQSIIDVLVTKECTDKPVTDNPVTNNPVTNNHVTDNPDKCFSDFINIMIKLKNAATCCNEDKPVFYASLSYYAKLRDSNDVIKFDDVRVNILNGYNRQNGKFCAPKRGVYLISCTIMALGTDVIQYELCKNGQTYAAGFAGASNSNTINSVVDMEKTDCVYIKHRTNCEGQTVVGNHFSYFSGFLII